MEGVGLKKVRGERFKVTYVCGWRGRGKGGEERDLRYLQMER